MPIFEYECANCRERFEVIEKAAEGKETTCPKCGRGGAKRILSAFACGSRKAPAGSDSSCGSGARPFS